VREFEVPGIGCEVIMDMVNVDGVGTEKQIDSSWYEKAMWKL